MKIDLHGLTLDEAIIELRLGVVESLQMDDLVIEIVHGYHGGQVLKTYLHSSQFERDMRKEGITISRLKKGSTPGAMLVKIQKQA
jgi:DNA-nicking Smr family endonuclease